jgi:nitroreductase
VTGFFDVVGAQRACRSFTDDDVPDDDIARVLAAAVCAPSAENSQPWVFVVVRDSARRARLASAAQAVWQEGGRARTAARLTPALFDDVDRSVEAGFGGARVLVVVAGDPTRVSRRAMASSIFPAVQNLLLAATALGYGSALTTLATFAADEVRAAVELPAHLEPMAVVPLGRPARALGRPRREPAHQKASLDRYGEPFAGAVTPPTP